MLPRPWTIDSHYISPSSLLDFLQITSSCKFLFPTVTCRVETAIARPVLACGGSFELRKCEHQSLIGNTGAISVTSVQTEIVSSEPDLTAQEIGKRLFIRYVR